MLTFFYFKIPVSPSGLHLKKLKLSLMTECKYSALLNKTINSERILMISQARHVGND